MAKVLGLTGGIASGKTTVSNYFKSFGIDVIDADKVAHEIMRAGQPVVKEIAAIFGEDIILENGEIDRKRLGKIVFESDAEREKLDMLVQSRIRQKIEEKRNDLLAKNKELIVLDIPLLYERNYNDFVDEVMVVYVDESVQKERLMNRDMELSEKDALNRIASQMPLVEKAKKADTVINNNETIEKTRHQIDQWLEDKGFSTLKKEKNH